MLKRTWERSPLQSVNDLVDAHDDHTKEHRRIKDKLADLENKSCRNNLKICGILKSVQAQALSAYTKSLFKVLVPDLKNSKLIIDRIHRLTKPPFLRDVILCIHVYHVKEQVMQNVSAKGTLPDPCSQLQLFADILTKMPF